MKSLFIITLIMLLSGLVSAGVNSDVNHYYKIDLRYDTGNLSYQGIAVEPSAQPLLTPEGKYIAEVLSYDHKILNFTFFAIPNTIFYDRADPETGTLVDGGTITLNQTKVALYVPYYVNAKKIDIYDQEFVKRLSIDVGDYAKETSASEAVQVPSPSASPKLNPEIISEPPAPSTGILVGISIGAAALILLLMVLLIYRWRIRKWNEKAR